MGFQDLEGHVKWVSVDEDESPKELGLGMKSSVVVVRTISFFFLFFKRFGEKIIKKKMNKKGLFVIISKLIY